MPCNMYGEVRPDVMRLLGCMARRDKWTWPLIHGMPLPSGREQRDPIEHSNHCTKEKARDCPCRCGVGKVDFKVQLKVKKKEEEDQTRQRPRSGHARNCCDVVLVNKTVPTGGRA